MSGMARMWVSFFSAMRSPSNVYVWQGLYTYLNTNWYYKLLTGGFLPNSSFLFFILIIHVPRQNPWPRTTTERILMELFEGNAAQFLAVLEALWDSSRRPLQTGTPDDPDLQEVAFELMSAGMSILSGIPPVRSTLYTNKPLFDLACGFNFLLWFRKWWLLRSSPQWQLAFIFECPHSYLHPHGDGNSWWILNSLFLYVVCFNKIWCLGHGYYDFYHRGESDFSGCCSEVCEAVV